MTDWQAVRDHVAVYVMGWHVQHDTDPIHGPFADYYDSSGRHVMDVDDWESDLSYHEVGMVIEAMRGRFSLTVHSLPLDRVAVNMFEYPLSSAKVKADTYSRGFVNSDELTLPQAITLAAALATGYKEDGDEV